MRFADSPHPYGISPFSFSVGDRKIMNHFVVNFCVSQSQIKPCFPRIHFGFYLFHLELQTLAVACRLSTNTLTNTITMPRSLDPFYPATGRH
jgi:hypothetical protein